MGSSLSNLVDNRTEGIHNIKCKYEHHNENVKHVELNTKILYVVLTTQAIKAV